LSCISIAIFNLDTDPALPGCILAANRHRTYENVSNVIKIDEECYQLQGQYKRAKKYRGGEVAKVAIKGNTKANGRYIVKES
jgi:hypothetical protein